MMMVNSSGLSITGKKDSSGTPSDDCVTRSVTGTFWRTIDKGIHEQEGSAAGAFLFLCFSSVAPPCCLAVSVDRWQLFPSLSLGCWLRWAIASAGPWGSFVGLLCHVRLAQLTVEHRFGHARVLHTWHMTGPTKLPGQKKGLNAGDVGSLQEFFYRDALNDTANQKARKPLQLCVMNWPWVWLYTH